MYPGVNPSAIAFKKMKAGNETLFGLIIQPGFKQNNVSLVPILLVEMFLSHRYIHIYDYTVIGS